MIKMFRECSSLTSLNLSNFNINNVISMNDILLILMKVVILLQMLRIG